MSSEPPPPSSTSTPFSNSTPASTSTTPSAPPLPPPPPSPPPPPPPLLCTSTPMHAHRRQALRLRARRGIARHHVRGQGAHGRVYDHGCHARHGRGRRGSLGRRGRGESGAAHARPHLHGQPSGLRGGQRFSRAAALLAVGGARRYDRGAARGGAATTRRLRRGERRARARARSKADQRALARPPLQKPTTRLPRAALLGPRGEPSPLGCRSEAAAALCCLPKVVNVALRPSRSSVG